MKQKGSGAIPVPAGISYSSEESYSPQAVLGKSVDANLRM